tara:strand:- start:1833 stop:3236 length:1404 start_codon:yes stop_codon:yes gene_type:complete
VRGIVKSAAYIPHYRLKRTDITDFFGTGSASGTRSVAAHDEDTVTMGFEAARMIVSAGGDAKPEALWFTTSEPPYLEKTNANVIHSALQLPKTISAYDFNGALKSGIGAMKTALTSNQTVLLVQADIRGGLPSSPDEGLGGDAAVAFLIGDANDDQLLARYLGGSSETLEFIDRWRNPREKVAKQWESRFVEDAYLPLIKEAWTQALANSSLQESDVSTVILSGQNERVKRQATKVITAESFQDNVASSIGNAGAAEAGLLLLSALEHAEVGQNVALCSFNDGVEILIFEVTSDNKVVNPIEDQIENRSDVSYGKFLQWREMLPVQPPNRPAPSRISASASKRESSWKHGFVASRGDQSGLIHMPPSRLSIDENDNSDAMLTQTMASSIGTVTTFTVDHLVYSQNPPVVFAVVDFDNGGRIPIEITDVGANEVEIGMSVEPTFRKLFTADGIHNYFWKVRPLRSTKE